MEASLRTEEKQHICVLIKSLLMTRKCFDEFDEDEERRKFKI